VGKIYEDAMHWQSGVGQRFCSCDGFLGEGGVHGIVLIRFSTGLGPIASWLLVQRNLLAPLGARGFVSMNRPHVVYLQDDQRQHGASAVDTISGLATPRGGLQFASNTSPLKWMGVI